MMRNKIIKSFFVLVTILVTAQSISAQDDILFRRRIVSSTWNSLLYGVAIDVIAQPESGAAIAGIPVVSAGIGALVPLLTNETRPITTNQLMLTSHGQSIGWLHGFALSMLVFGDSLFADNNNYKVAVGLGAATSIGLGFLGKSLGKNQNWSEGQVALYKHYGWVGPATTMLIASSFVDDPRVYGGTILLGGAGSYFLADKINDWHEYTRGDIRATQALTVLNGALGYCVLADIQGTKDEFEFARAEMLIPAAGLVLGTAVSHFWLKDVNLTPRQGMTTIWATSGGAILGTGISLLVNSDDWTINYAIPYVTSLGAYAFAVESLRRKNNSSAFLPGSKGKGWDFAFMPYNLMLNNKIDNNNGMLNGRLVGMQPLFAASLTF